MNKHSDDYWILIIGPWESRTNRWEFKIFDTNEELESYRYRNDLTKEHYVYRIDALIEMLRKDCDESEQYDL